MDVGLLFSGGKDSALAGLLLESVADVTAITCSFGITNDVAHARAAAEAVGFDHVRVALDESVAREAAERIVDDGFPRHGIQQVHEHALETVASRAAAGGLAVEAVADGTRRDDRVPTVERSLAQHLEDTHGVHHLAPLAGLGRGAVDALVAAHLEVETGESEVLPMGDYEAELRALIADEWGTASVEDSFPTHVQSRVVGRAGAPKS